MKMLNKRRDFFDLLLDNWWLRHILFWITFEIYYMWGLLDPKPEAKFDMAHVERHLAFLPGFLLVVYPLLYFLIPKFLIHKKFIQFILAYFILIGIAVIYADFFNLNFSKTSSFAGFDWLIGKNIIPFIHVSAIAATMKMMRYAFLQERREYSNKSLRNLAELELLKAQIHPHFLFNTLNNLFAHTIKKSPDSGKIVLKLSDLLRFMVYDSREEEILLEKEISLLTDYIELEKLRYGKDLNVSIHFSGDIEGRKIRPLLLLPLIENSFKHGTSQQLDQKWISLDLSMNGDIMELNLANSRDSDDRGISVAGKSKGIGIENVQRRLELLYSGIHEFRITTEKDMFSIYLKLKLSYVQPRHENIFLHPKLS
ncbi:MAG TPA: histidine kinase [Chitinophagaceae bacterium]|nr:histidine kinase [Chitinophagaceae bacterium]